jgi:hypothetical protein
MDKFTTESTNTLKILQSISVINYEGSRTVLIIIKGEIINEFKVSLTRQSWMKIQPNFMPDPHIIGSYPA